MASCNRRVQETDRLETSSLFDMLYPDFVPKAFERREERWRRKEADKKLLRLWKEIKEIPKQQRALGYEPLDPPIQRGWKRTFVLRQDVKISPQAEFFESLLEKINNVQYSHRRDFKNKKKRKGRKIQVDRIQKLHDLEEYYYKKARLTTKQQLYFDEVVEISPIKKHVKTVKHVFNEPWRFVLKVSPDMITQVKIIDPELEQRETQLDNYVTVNNLRPRIMKLIGESYSYRNRWNPQPKEKYKVILKAGFLEIEEWQQGQDSDPARFNQKRNNEQ